MIKRKDVITIKIPFPDICSSLAVNSHMYVCRRVQANVYGFVKCQTLKPYMLSAKIFQHYWDEEADITRNPFKRKTRIDCDKEFLSQHIFAMMIV